MTDYIVASRDELKLLTKTERLIYEAFRHEGKTKEVICEEQGITDETFRSHWSRALKKIRERRLIIENPQRFIGGDKDILTNKQTVLPHSASPAGVHPPTDAIPTLEDMIL